MGAGGEEERECLKRECHGYVWLWGTRMTREEEISAVGAGRWRKRNADNRRGNSNGVNGTDADQDFTRGAASGRRAGEAGMTGSFLWKRQRWYNKNDVWKMASS